MTLALHHKPQLRVQSFVIPWRLHPSSYRGGLLDPRTGGTPTLPVPCKKSGEVSQPGARNISAGSRVTRVFSLVLPVGMRQVPLTQWRALTARPRARGGSAWGLRALYLSRWVELPDGKI